MKAVTIMVLACGMLAVAIPQHMNNQPRSLSQAEVDDLLRKINSGANIQVRDGDLSAAVQNLQSRMDEDSETDSKISKRIWHTEETTTAHPGWGPPAHGGWGPPPAHGGPQMGLVGPFAFQLGAYYNPYLPVPQSYGSSYTPQSYNAPATSYGAYTTPAPSYSSSSYTTAAPSYGASSYTTAAPSYGSSSYGSSSSYTTPAPSYGSSSYTTAAPSYGASSYTTAAPSYDQVSGVAGYLASASYPSHGHSSYGHGHHGYGAHSGYSRSSH